MKSVEITYTASSTGPTAPTFKIGGETFANGTKFANPVTLTITGDSGNSFFYTYTTGSTTPSDPDTNSTGYTGPITINAEGTYYYKAIAKDGSNNTSSVTSANFIVATQYGITCASNLTGGTVSTDVANAFAGDEVTVTAKPSTGYALDAITVTGATSGALVTVTNGKFTMPAEAVNVTATFTVSNTIFEETWSGTSGTGGNDGNWSGSIASATLTADNSGWTVENAGGASACAKFGTSSKKGVATTPDIAVANNTVYKLTFKAAAWGTSDATNLPISATGGSLYLEEACTNSVSSVTMANSAWTTYTVYVKTSSTTLNITWQGNAANNSRFFLDEVKFETVAAKAYTISVASGITNGSVVVSPTSSDGNEDITVTATPDTGYQLALLTFNSGTPVTSGWTTTNGVSTYTYALTTGDLEVGATFNKVNFTLTRNSSDLSQGDVKITDVNGNELSTQPTTAQMGDVIYFKPTTTWGYQLGTITVTNNTTSSPITPTVTDGVYSFTMPAGNVTIAATFVVYHPTVKLAGRYNGNTSWRTAAADCATFTYDSSSDKYTIDAYFTGEGEGNYFFLLADGAEKHPTSDGNWGVQYTDGTAVGLTWSGSNNFSIENGVYTIELKGDLTEIAFTKKSYSLAFSPASGSSVETGSTASVSCSALVSDIAAIKTADSGAAGDVTVGVNDDNGSTWSSSYTFVNADEGSKTIYGKAYIGNIAVTGSASYTVRRASTSTSYQLVTDANDLEAGAKYLIVNGSGSGTFKAIGTQTTGNNKPGVDISVADNVATATSDIGIFELASTEDSNYPWQFVGTFIEGTSKYLAASDGDSNRLQYTTSDATRTNASIAIASSGAATVIFNATRGNLYYNGTGSNSLFNCYKGAQTDTGYELVRIYKQVATGAYTITYTEVTGGTLSGRADANEGDVITVTATASTGYACTSVSVNPSAAVTDNHDGTYTFTMPASNVTVTPTWAPAIAISYVNKYLDNNGENPTEGNAGGTVTGPSSAVEGAPVNVTVTPDDAYQLQSLTYEWASGSRDITEGKTFLMPATPTTVTAVFEKKPFNLTVVSANGQVTGVPATAVSGQTVRFTITPVAGYTITNVFYEYENNDETLSTAITPSEGVYSFNMPAKDVTIRVGYFAGDEYELLTDEKDIVEGETYLIVGGAASGDYTHTHVMGTTLSNKRLNAVELTSATYNNGIISSSSSMNLVDFVEGTGDNAGKWAIHTADGYLYSTSTGNIQCGSTPYYSSISVDAGDHNRATIQLVDGNYQLSFHSGSPMFRFYSGSQGATYIYKLANSNKVKKPTITGAAGQYIGLYNFIGTDQVTLACATDGSSIEYKIGSGEWIAYSEPFALPQTALDGTVTVSARATKTGMDASDEVSAVFTCVKPEWHTKPCGDNWNCTDQEYDNPVFIYPIASLACRNAYGRANTRFFYTLDGTTPTMASAEVATPSSGEKFLFLDKDVILTIIPVINDIAGDAKQGIITFKPAAPTATLAADSYDGDQQTRLSTTTKSSLNGTSWTTKIYYALETTTGTTPAAFAFNSSTGEVTSAGWTLYDPTTSPYIDILLANGDVQTLHAVTLTNFYGGEFTGQYSGASVNLNTTGTWVKSDETEVEYTLTAANLDVVFSPAGGTYLYAKDVTLKAQNAIGTATILYSLTWANPDADHTNVSAETYTQPIHIDQDATLYVYAADERTGDGSTYEKTHVYKIGVQEPLYSPYPGDYYDEDTDKYLYGDYYVLPSSGTSTLDVEIFDVSPNARIYYTFTKTATNDATYDGSQPYPEPAVPTNTTGTLYSGPITIEQGYTYVFSAIAYVGDLASPVRTRAFTVRTNTDSGDYWYSVKEMNEDNSGVTKTFANPVQVIWMSTHRYDQVTPEYCFISDNSGYGMVFFRSSSDAPSYYQTYTKFKQGDWLPGKSITGTTAVWSSHYINELGGGSGTGANVTAWPSAAMNSRPITPEAASCKAIRDGWTYGNGTPTSYSGKDYKSYVDEEKNLFGHYVHLRKNTITQVTGDGGGSGKHTGIITGEHGTPLQYYDGFYLFSGYSYVDSETNKTVTTVDYNQDFFNSVQNLGGTFDVYAVVQFYGTNTTNATYSYAPFEVFPIAFDWIFPPIFHLEGDASASDMTNDNPERTIHAPSTVTLTCDTRGAIMWYKTSDMEDYEVYEGQEIPVTKSMEISTYSIHSTEFFDQLESKVRTLTINMGDVEQPVISPESCVKAIGDEAVTVSIACETEDATIWYTTDGSDPADETNANRSEYTDPFTVSETTTVRAIASAQDGSETFYGMEAESKTYTFVKSNGIVYDLVKSASQLDPGYVYVIVNKQYNAAVMNVQDTNNRKSAGVKFLESTDAGYTGEKEQVFGNDDLAVFTLNNENGNWVFHTANGVNNASIGYMYGAVSGSTNQWKSEFTKDTEGKTLTTITIDGDNSNVDKAYAAHILYTGGSGDRYLRFNKSYDLFNTYSSEMTGQEVFLYRKLAWPLAKIEKVGVKDREYTISDELIGVYANGTKLWAKDQGNVSISKRENTEGWEDYVAALYPNAHNKAEWDQSNWVCLELGDADDAAALVGQFITPTSVTGILTDKVNYTITVNSTPTSNGDAGFQATDKVSTTSVNVMTAPNFNDAYTGENGAQTTAAAGRTFFFVRPKVQEVVTVTNVTWDGSKFVIPAKNGPHNTADFNGAINVNWDLYEGTNKSTIESQMESLVAEQSDMEFTFMAVVSAPTSGGSGAPRRAPKAGDATTTLVLQPTSITLPATPTGVDDVKVANREVKAVKYVDVVGRVSDRPFEGLNIIVTEYTDGSVETVKVLK